MKRFLTIILSVALLCTFVPAASAATSDQESAAQSLHDLGLFQGTGNNTDGTPDFDLDRAPTRAEAITMLVRLLGKEEEAKAGTWTTPFTDVADWAKPYVGYAYANGLTTGTSDTTFGGDATVNATQYLTFVLRTLGYTSGTDFQWDSAWTKSDEIKLTDGRYNANTISFTRGDVAIISNNALKVFSASERSAVITYRSSTLKDLQEALACAKSAGMFGLEDIIRSMSVSHGYANAQAKIAATTKAQNDCATVIELMDTVNSKTAHVREIFETKPGAEPLVAKLTELERLCQSISNTPVSLDSDTLTEMLNRTADAANLFADICEIILTYI